MSVGGARRRRHGPGGEHLRRRAPRRRLAPDRLARAQRPAQRAAGHPRARRAGDRAAAVQPVPRRPRARHPPHPHDRARHSRHLGLRPHLDRDALQLRGARRPLQRRDRQRARRAIQPACGRSIEGLLRQRVDAIVLIVVDVGVLEVVRGLDLSIPVVAAASTAAAQPADRVDRPVPRCARRPCGTSPSSATPASSTWRADPSAPTPLERVRGWRDELAAHRLEVHRAAHRRLVGSQRLSTSARTLDIAAGVGGLRPPTTTWRSGCCRRCASGDSACPRTSAWSASTTCPRPATSTRRSRPCVRTSPALGELIMQKVLVAVEEPESATEDTPMPTHLIVRQSTSAPLA